MTRIDVYDVDADTLTELADEFDVTPRDIVEVLLTEIDMTEIKELLKRYL